MRVVILGSGYEVVRVELPDGVEGECRPEHASLCVSTDVVPARQWAVLRHELGHAAFYESGCRTALKAMGLTEEQLEHAEEIVMDSFVAVFCDSMERVGWLMPPVLP